MERKVEDVGINKSHASALPVIDLTMRGKVRACHTASWDLRM